jgi:hypothetical protein
MSSHGVSIRLLAELAGYSTGERRLAGYSTGERWLGGYSTGEIAHNPCTGDVEGSPSLTS